MSTVSVECLRELSEPLLTLSLSHLTASTRNKLQANALSVNAYPTEYGGLIFIGAPPHRLPAESDLAAIGAATEPAGVVWLLFDAEAPVIDGLPLFGIDDSAT